MTDRHLLDRLGRRQLFDQTLLVKQIHVGSLDISHHRVSVRCDRRGLLKLCGLIPFILTVRVHQRDTVTVVF